MSSRASPSRVALARAKEIVVENVAVTAAERVAVEAAVGRVIAEPVFARLASPHSRVSAMDGIAVRAADTLATGDGAVVVLAPVDDDALAGPPAGDARAGHGDVMPPPPAPNVCRPVDTGNALPAWADAVVRIEDARRTPAGYEVRSPVAPGRDVRAVGEDVAAGALLVGRGRVVSAVDLGGLLATGIAHVAVRARPRVGVLATGSEVIEPLGDDAVPAPGQVIEFNARVLAAYARDWGAYVDVLGRAPDDEHRLAETIRLELAAHDLLCVIAGSSAGRKDFTIAALRACGEILFQGVDVMPGRPVALARVEGKLVLAIPGYPVSAVVAMRELLRPALDAALGRAPARSARVRALVRRNIGSRLGVEEIVRVCLAACGDDFVVAPLPRGAGSISSLVRAHGLLRIGPGSEGIAAGSVVDVELLDCNLDLSNAVVVAGPSDPFTAALEDALAASGSPVRMSHLGLAPHDALTALAAGEAHVALLDDAAHGIAVSDAVTCEIVRDARTRRRLLLSASFAASAAGRRLREALAGDALRDALRRLVRDYPT